MIASILGAVTGFGGSVIPAVLDHFQNKQKSKERIEEQKMKLEFMSTRADIDMKMFEQQAADKEHERLIKHDIALSKQTGIIAGLQKAVRPVITYSFFAIFMAVEIITIYLAVNSGMDLKELKEVMWTPETQAIFASIISFWFGSRSIEKMKKISK